MKIGNKLEGVKGIVPIIFIMLIISFAISSVCAITGSLGNARMILNAKVGEQIEKSILVKNTNNVTVEIELSSSGDLGDSIIIKDKKFELLPGEEKKAFFTIKIAKEGTTESKIDVKFTPKEGKNGVGLSSTIIVVAEKGDSLFNFGGNESENKINGTAIGIILTGFVIVVLIGLSAVYSINKKKRAEKEGENKIKKSAERL
jgi:hypothetical protein